MRIKFFLIFFFSILLIFPIFVNSKEECIFDKYIQVKGDYVCINCIIPGIISKELSNVCITPLKNDVKVYFDPTKDNPHPPNEIPEKRKSSNEPFCINKPPINNIGYYYRVESSEISNSQPIKIQFVDYNTYQKECNISPPPPSNSPPQWICQNEYTIKEKYEINLTKCFNDKDNDILTYTYLPLRINNISINIKNGIAELIVHKSFSGNRIVTFTANDGKNSTNQKISLIIEKKSKPQPPDKWGTLISFLSKNWKWMSPVFLIIAGIFYAKFKWKTPIKDSVKGVRKKAVGTFEKTIKKFGISKTNK